MSAWAEIRGLIRARDERALADRVLALDPPGRAEVAARLPEFLGELEETAVREAGRNQAARLGVAEDELPEWARLQARSEARWRLGQMLRVYAMQLWIAGTGTISGPAAAAAWLGRADLAAAVEPTPARLRVLMRVFRARPRDWQADVAVRLARRVRAPRDAIVPLALRLLRVTGAEPPPHDPLVVAWLSSGVNAGDPLLDRLLPRLFEADGVGRELRDDALARRWLDLLLELLATGRVSRDALLDGCIRRFLRGGEPADLRFFARLHERIDPAPEEVSARLRDYLRLLPTAPAAVAEPTVRRLRRTGRVGDADAAEAIGALAFRVEAGLVRAGLGWLEERVRRAPGTAAELAGALAAAFGHTSSRVQERAARIAIRHAAAFAPAADVIAEAVPLLPAGLGAQVAAHFGGEVAPAETAPPFSPPPRPAVEPPGPHPAPTLDLPEERLTDPAYAEAWLAAFVARAAADREGLRAELAGRVSRYHTYIYGFGKWLQPRHWLRALALEAVTPGRDPGPPEPPRVDPRQVTDDAGYAVSVEVLGDAEASGGDEGWRPAFRELPEYLRQEIFRQALQAGVPAERVAAWRAGRPEPPARPGEPRFRVVIRYLGHDPLTGGPVPTGPVAEYHRRRRLPHPGDVPPPHLFLLYRLEEVYAALRAGALPPVLLATPTLATGHLDPDVLVDRLAACAAAGAEPLRADLCQALLRLPRGRHPAAAARAARIGTPAAAAAAGWLAEGGPPDPETGVRWLYGDGRGEAVAGEPPRGREATARPVPVLRAKPSGHDLVDALLREPCRHGYPHVITQEWWPAMLPSHREVVALNYLPLLTSPYGATLPGLDGLAAADGPAGDATATVFAFQLAVEPSRTVGPLVTAAAKGGLPAETIGRRLAVFLHNPSSRPRPVLEALAAAARQGAHREVWRILTALLPAFLPAPGERPSPSHTEAVALAAEVAAWAGAQGEIPVVSAHAASGRRSRFVRECVRLRDRLNGAPPAP